jgi:hypothetical protein
MRAQRRQSSTEFVDGLVYASLEAGEVILGLRQHFYEDDYFFIIFVQSLVALDHPFSESFEALTIEASKQSYNISSDLEGSCLKVQQSRRKDKAKIDVD